MALYNYILLAVLFLLLGFLIISVKRKLIKKGWLKGIFYVITSIAIVLMCTGTVRQDRQSYSPVWLTPEIRLQEAVLHRQAAIPYP